MPYCKYCGSAVDNDAVFCTECGKRIKDIKMPIQTAVPPKQEAAVVVRGEAISADELMQTDPKKLQAYMDNVTKYRMAMTMLNQFYNTLDEWSNYDLEMWAESEAAMREKYGIPEISIYRFLKPERRETLTKERRTNRSYTKKDTKYWSQFDQKKDNSK